MRLLYYRSDNIKFYNQPNNRNNLLLDYYYAQTAYLYEASTCLARINQNKLCFAPFRDSQFPQNKTKFKLFCARR